MVRHSENNLDREKLLCASLIDARADNNNRSTQSYGEHNHFNDALFDQKLELATEGIEPYEQRKAEAEAEFGIADKALY